MGSKKYKATVAEDFKIHEEGVIVEYKKGKIYTSTSKKRITNLRNIKKLI